MWQKMLKKRLIQKFGKTEWITTDDN